MATKPKLPPFPPNTHFLPLETNWGRATWYHGTRSSLLAGIAAQGVMPRANRKSAGNWELHPSSPVMVYLTTAYGLHYAKAVDAPGLVAILELDLSTLDRGSFFADEDSYALSRVADMPELQYLSLEKKVAYWRDNLHLTDPEVGLQVMGNATYKGIIPAAAVKKVRLLTDREALTMTLQISDPVVSPSNFKIMGGAAQLFHRWLLGYETNLNDWFQRMCTPSLPLMSLYEAVAYDKAHGAT